MIGIIGDWHLGAGYNLAPVDNETQLNARLIDFGNTFNNIVSMFVKNKVGLLLLTGDIFETRHPTSAQLNMFSKCIRQTIEKGIEVALCVGNHDQQRNISTTTLDVFRSLNIPELKVFKEFEVFKYDGANIIFMPYRDKKMMGASKNSEAIDEIDKILEELCKNLKGPKIAFGHFMLEKSPEGSNPDTFSLNELLLPLDIFKRFDATIMGHIHKHEIIQNSPPIIYSGSMDKVSFGEKDHTKVSIILDHKNPKKYKIIPTNTRNLYEMVFDFSEEALKNNLNQAIIDSIEVFNQDKPLEGSIVKVITKIKESDLHFINPDVIKYFITTKKAFHCASVQVSALNTRQLRNSKLTEVLTGKKAFELYLDNLDIESTLKNKLKKYANEIIEEVEKR